MSTTQPDRIEFSVDPAIIRSLIKEQASTFEKAIAELVMNAIDAGASRIDIDLTANGFRVTDDGRGFASRDEILTCFGRFGAPHEDGDATFGRFRIGRGQIMHWARCDWRSNTFKMSVDVQDVARGISYDLTSDLPEQSGCVVTGAFYPSHMTHGGIAFRDHNASSPSPLARDLLIWITAPARSSIANLVAYVDAEVYLNGTRINMRPSDGRTRGKNKSWTQIDDLAYWLIDRDAELRIYNLGVLVKTMPARTHGVGGIIVTKHALQLNMARNEIIYDDLWGELCMRLEDHFYASLKANSQPSHAEAQRLIWLAANEAEVPLSVRRLRRLKIFKSPAGSYHSYAELTDFPFVTLTRAGHETVAERIHDSKLAFPIDDELVSDVLYYEEDPDDDDDLESDATEFFFEDELWPNIIVFFDPNRTLSCPRFRHFWSLKAETAIQANVIDPETLTEEEKEGLETANAINDVLFGAERDLKPGTSETAEAWTDGEHYIAIDRAQLAACSTQLHGLAKLALLLLHEYCHDEPSTGSHTHNLAFYRQFHERALDPEFTSPLTHLIGTDTINGVLAAGLMIPNPKTKRSKQESSPKGPPPDA